MNLLTWMFGTPAASTGGSANRNPADDFWYQPIGAPSAAGVPVTFERALTAPVVFDCISVLANTIGALPWGIYERQPDGSRRRSTDHPLNAVLNRPNPETTDVEFFTQLVWDIAPCGNFFAEVVLGANGQVAEIRRQDPQTVTVERLADRSRVYEFASDNGTRRRLGEDAVWHIRDFPHLQNGLIGSSRIVTGREAIGAALAVQDYAARFFRNDATPPFVLSHPNQFKDDVSRTNFRTAIKRWWGGVNRHSPGILEWGIKLERVGINNDEAQFLETKKEAAVECARLWRIPPHKVGILDKATFSNIEQQALEFVTDTLLPWLRLIEKSIARELILDDDRFFFEFNVAGLLRGDLKARYEAYAAGRQWGWLSVNDIRKLENMNPIAGGDRYLQPLNMVPAGGGSPRPRESEDERRVYGPDGRVVSKVTGGNVIRMEDYLNAA